MALTTSIAIRTIRAARSRSIQSSYVPCLTKNKIGYSFERKQVCGVEKIDKIQAVDDEEHST